MNPQKAPTSSESAFELLKDWSCPRLSSGCPLTELYADDGVSTHSTRWTLIQRAAAGNSTDRDAFVAIYGPVIGAYLGTRWRGTSLRNQIDDAVQEVLLDCIQEGGALGRADPGHASGFRAFLYGVVRNTARTMERAHARTQSDRGGSVNLDEFAAKEDSVAQVFDRAWASALLRRAADLQEARARQKGKAAERRHLLLGLRYGNDMPIRDIAKHWQVEPDWLHGQFRQARDEFRSALQDVVKELQGGGPESIAEECRLLLQHFS